MFDIIIPTFMTPLNLLKGCLDSVRAQTFKDYQVYICDGTPHEWKRYGELQALFSQYPEFTVVRQEGKGVSQARNQIIKMGSNPYVAFLDSDDQWNSFYLESILEEGINKSRHDSIGIWFTEIKEKHYTVYPIDLLTIGMEGVVGVRTEVESVLQSYDVLNFMPLEYQYYFHKMSPLWFSATVISREQLMRSELFDEEFTMGEDTKLLLELVELGIKSQFLPFVGCIRNSHSGQLTKQPANKTNSWLDVYNESVAEIRKDPYEHIQELQGLDESQIPIMLAYMTQGKHRGYSTVDCKQKIELMNEEDYLLETL